MTIKLYQPVGKPISTYQKVLHLIDLKLTKTTTYDYKPFTLARLVRHVVRVRILSPIRDRFHFGYCECCGKWAWHMENITYGADYEPDEEDPTRGYAVAYTGYCCQFCVSDAEERRYI